MVDLSILDSLMWGRLATDAEGADVRTAVGSRIVRREALRPAAVPATPFLALHIAPAAQLERDMYQAIYDWSIYDADGAGEFQIRQIAALIASAYDARKVQYTTGGVVGLVEATGLYGGPRDDALGLSVRALRMAVLLS